MRRAEPLEPEVEAALAAIDATLAGEPVDPEFAEQAELALMLRAARPVPEAAVSRALDERVAALGARPPRRRWGRPSWGQWARPRGRWLAGPLAALTAVGVAVVIAGSGGLGSSHRVEDLTTSSSASAASASAPSAGGASGSLGASSASSSASATSTTAGASGSASGASGSAAPTSGPAAPAPGPAQRSARQIVQSAELALSTTPGRIDGIAQQVFDVVDAEQGFVSSSHVTSTGHPDASAYFELSVPSAHLQRTVSELSRLSGAHVISRSDDTQDITGQVGGAGRQLAEARALRRALLGQLAAATSGQAIASLQAQLRDADAAIGRDASALAGLAHQVSDSRLTVTIQAASAPIAPVVHGGGFTLSRAVHDAGRVLVVVAGIGLIALAVLVPLGLVIGVLTWIVLALARRRREAALDLV